MILSSARQFLFSLRDALEKGIGCEATFSVVKDLDTVTHLQNFAVRDVKTTVGMLVRILFGDSPPADAKTVMLLVQSKAKGPELT